MSDMLLIHGTIAASINYDISENIVKTMHFRLIFFRAFFSRSGIELSAFSLAAFDSWTAAE